jgi:hypothetical protein
MLVYVCGDNLLVMLVGWEGIGICSYLLIGYYSHRLAAVKSAQQAILVNRISDGMLLWGVLWIWHYTGSLEYDLVLLNDTSSISMFIVLSVLIGAMGKSAQILFHVWLASAMEGPTPVSALIHAATLVTAGIYLMVRLGPIMTGSDLVILVGCLTALMAGVFGFFQSDLKRVIAFSTCSQLGYAQDISNLNSSHLNNRCYSTEAGDAPLGGRSINLLKDIIPVNHVEKFDNLTSEQKYNIKNKYKKTAKDAQHTLTFWLVYVVHRGVRLPHGATVPWQNKLNSKCYIGSTINLSSRLANYFDSYYLNKTTNKMAICAALLQYGYINFNLYVLEVFPAAIDTKLNLRSQLLIREAYFVSLVKPSYNIAAILNAFVGENHPRFGKSVSQEIKDKISKSLTGRKPSDNHRKGANKKPVYCYDFFTKEFVIHFESIRSMSRSLEMGLQRKMDNKKPFNCVYKGEPQKWILVHKPL